MADPSIAGLVQQILRDIRGTWRFRWPALAVAWFVCAAGWLAVLSMPDVYEARARVFVDTSSRLRDVLGTIAFSPDIESRVNIVRQAMLGRQQLEKVAVTTGVLDDARSAEDRERQLAALRDAIGVSVGRGSMDRNMFSITYQSADRTRSIAVVDSLLNTFVEDVLQQKAQGADAAQRFLRQQIEHYGSQLEEADKRLAEFKRENVGLMPGEGGDYFANMQTEVAALEQLRSDLRIAESRREELRRQLRGEDPFLAEGASLGGGAGAAGGTGLDIDTRIAQLERSLDDLLLRFTDQHPDVIGVKQQIAQLRDRRREELAALAASGDGIAGATSPVYQRVQIALNEANVEIAALEAQVADGERRVASLRELINTMPEVEAELARLTRDYASTNALYNQLLAQLERERLVEEGDDSEVVNFEVIDPPTADIDPVAPRRTVLLLGVLIFGLGAGGGMAYLLNMLRPVFADVAQLQSASGLPVIGAVSRTMTARARHMKRVGALSYAGLAVLLVVAAGAVVTFRDFGVNIVQGLVS